MNPSINPEPTSSTAQASSAGAVRSAALRNDSSRPPGPDQRLADGRARSPRQAHDGELHAAMRDDEAEQRPREAMRSHEGEYGAEHQPIETEYVQRTEPEQESQTIGEQAHHDVVGQNLHRQHGGGHDVEQTLRPQLATLDRC